MTEYKLLSQLLPKRKEDGHKGDNGILTVIAGSDTYRGAPYLNVSAALRCGIGIVRLVSTERVIASVSARVGEAIYLPVNENTRGGVDASDVIKKQKNFINSGAVLVGCGMKDIFDTEAVVSSLLSNFEGGLVIDADGLNSIKNCPERLKNASKTPIITPHIGEMSRLVGISASEISENRVAVAKAFSSEFGCVTVLKDAVTVIASPEGELFSFTRMNSGMSKGGSGDVLSGIIASLYAQGLKAYSAACAGTVIHSLAGKMASDALTAEFMLPSDIIDSITDVYKNVKKFSEI